MSRRVLITGGAGFVGFHLTRRLLAEDATEVTLVDNFVRGRRDAELEALLASTRVDLIQADLCDPSVRAKLGSGYDEVYHLAAVIGVKNVLERPHDVVRVNALTTLNLLDWMALENGGGRFLFSSTSEAYAWTRQFHELPTPTPEDVPLALTDLGNPRSSYAGSKVFGELAVTQYGRAHAMEFAITRYHNVYGPRMGWEHVVPELHERALAGQNPLVVYSPEHTRAFCYVDDAVEATMRAMRDPRGAGGTFNVGNDREEIRIGALAERILAVAGLEGVAIEARGAAHDPITRRCPDVTRARQRLGYEPVVSLDEGLRRTLAWYAEHPRPAV
jgi:nucleoside-diphosphate-sugar epimerase